MNTPYILVIVLDAQDTKMTLSPPPMSLQTSGEKLANSKSTGNSCNKAINQYRSAEEATI